MAEQPHNIVEIVPPADKAFGARKDENLRASFASSPIFKGELTDNERKTSYTALCLDGDVNDSNQVAGSSVPGGQGHGINSYSRDFSGAPDLSQVETGGGGLPASPYMPNPASPGPGSISPADIPEFIGKIPDLENNIEFGSGLGGLVSPSETSSQISQQTLGNYISGKSYLGSDGKN
jgi:hypothetical protein